MKKVLKIIFSAALLLTLVFVLGACRTPDEPAPPPAEQPTPPPPAVLDPPPPPPPPEELTDANLNVFLVSHSPPPASTLDDGSFNQGAADGILRFVADNPGSSFSFLQPHEPNDEARLDIFADAIAAGADVLVLPGFHFEHVINDAQNLFPDTYFIVLDTGPSGGVAERNLVGITYAEQQSGFLAGYAAVMEGYTELGFMGGIAVPAVVRFGIGFVQGAEHAAQKLGLEPGSVTINYMYVGGFGPEPRHTITAAGWYAAGTEVIFVAAGGVGFSVQEAAEAAGTWMIGVDVDQGWQSESVLTSAMKALDVSVYNMLSHVAAGTFPGGQTLRLDATADGVALPMATSRFSNFTEAQYNAILADLVAGRVVVSDLTTFPNFDGPAELAPIVAALTIVNVIEM